MDINDEYSIASTMRKVVLVSVRYGVFNLKGYVIQQLPAISPHDDRRLPRAAVARSTGSLLTVYLLFTRKCTRILEQTGYLESQIQIILELLINNSYKHFLYFMHDYIFFIWVGFLKSRVVSGIEKYLSISSVDIVKSD